MGLKVAAIQVFNDHYEIDKKTVVLSELFVRSNAMKNPIGNTSLVGRTVPGNSF